MTRKTKVQMMGIVRIRAELHPYRKTQEKCIVYRKKENKRLDDSDTWQTFEIRRELKKKVTGARSLKK